MRHLILIFILAASQNLFSQAYKPDMHDKTQWITIPRGVKYVEENGKKAIKIEEGEGTKILILKNSNFSNGTIEFDAKGRNVIGQSFVGLAFHVQNDSTYDAIYFRPFNFANPDTIRRWRAVQYISIPGHEWNKLREKFPGKYENKVNPVPNADEWFHAKIVIKNRTISVYVNNSPIASLVVNKLSDTSKGMIGLWVEPNSDGSFANLEIQSEN